MGVHGLWDVLEPAGEKDVLVTILKGKIVAVDLGVWIMEASGLRVNKTYDLHTRTIFYRTLFLLSHGVRLVFVFDGQAPDVKQQTLRKRQQAAGSSSVNCERQIFSKLMTRCEKLGKSLGIPCIQSPGEGEAMCAFLDKTGLVDGTFTHDSDYFCYGGKTMYRLHSKENKSYKMDVYTSSGIEAALGLCQDDMVGLALLLGCDYDLQGVPGVGGKKALALCKALKDRGIDFLNRLRSWTTNSELDDIERKLDQAPERNPHCKRCEHLGKRSTHEKSGCSICRTESSCLESCDRKCPCDWHNHHSFQQEHKLEISIRSKACNSGSKFPKEEVITEFKSADSLDVDQTQLAPWGMDIAALSVCMGWNQEKVLKNIVPVVILYQLHGICEDWDTMFTPVRIQGACKDNHVECYEVEWDKTDKNTWAGELYATDVKVKISKQLFSDKFPAMVKHYEQAIADSKKKKSTSGKRKRKMAEDPAQSRSLAIKDVRRKLEPEFGQVVATDKGGSSGLVRAGSSLEGIFRAQQRSPANQSMTSKSRRKQKRKDPCVGTNTLHKFFKSSSTQQERETASSRKHARVENNTMTKIKDSRGKKSPTKEVFKMSN
ncbi:flap endonuclease GEN homolog 1-like [Mya arenaria]|uniref:flap endonuclease GEN homolog 1-like n=1 Tax=Mya arenaria TaxID=6604 RepID=UPI0022E59082|nr:flap endonuclease GEN homolog 1-like [Mya arenaria]